MLSCESIWILARTSAKDDWLFCDADGVGESFCFLIAGSVVALASRHVAMSKRVVYAIVKYLTENLSRCRSLLNYALSEPS